jgi:hypothetical protein
VIADELEAPDLDVARLAGEILGRGLARGDPGRAERHCRR